MWCRCEMGAFRTTSSTPPLGHAVSSETRGRPFPVEQLEKQMDATCVPAASQTTTRWETTFTHTTLAPFESNVTLLIPRTSQRIFYLPVACASFTSVTDGQNTMVKTRISWSSEYARGVQLKQVLVCLNGCRHELLCHCRHHCLFAVGRYIRVANNSALRNAHVATQQVTSFVCCGRQGCSVRTWNVPNGQSASDPRMQDRVHQRRCAIQTQLDRKIRSD